MPPKPNPIPDGFQSAVPALAMHDAMGALEFYKTAFGAEEVMKLPDPSGILAHGEFKIGGALVMLAEENPNYNASPKTLGGTSVIIHLYVEDVDAFMARAAAAGATIVVPPRDQFYGDRSGRLMDPYGYIWAVASHVEDVSVEEMQRRFEAMTKPT